MKKLFLFLGFLATGCPVAESLPADVTDEELSTLEECQTIVERQYQEYMELDSEEQQTFEELATCNGDVEDLRRIISELMGNVWVNGIKLEITEAQLKNLLEKNTRQWNDLFVACTETCLQLHTCSCLQRHFPAEYALYAEKYDWNTDTDTGGM